ncbi:MAG: hypothetical protein QHH15_02755 [Candidatus Thermoplasmatota archaeon]|jgi:hypothetical protein|nr:hypothetical protein [Candidatus Thermoplasmatota archaeon]
MGKVINCYYWNPNLGIEDEIDFVYETIGAGIELKKTGFYN